MSEPKILALDVAVLLPRVFRQHLARLNAMLVAPPDGFRFDETHLPHVTLVQQFVRADSLDRVTHELSTALRDVAPLELRVAGLSHERTTSTLQLAPTTGLAQIHVILMNQFQRLDACNGNASAFLSEGEPVRKSDIEWVRQFRADAAYSRFDPAHHTGGWHAVNTGVTVERQSHAPRTLSPWPVLHLPAGARGVDLDTLGLMMHHRDA